MKTFAQYIESRLPSEGYYATDKLKNFIKILQKQAFAKRYPIPFQITPQTLERLTRKEAEIWLDAVVKARNNGWKQEENKPEPEGKWLDVIKPNGERGRVKDYIWAKGNMASAGYKLVQESSEPDLAYLLGPAGSIPQIGPERQVGDPSHGSVKFLSPHGSYRYVQYVDGKPASALQIVSRDGINGQVANVYTLPEYRKQGLARGLLDRARRGFESITHSKDLSSLGAIWKGKVQESADPLMHSEDDPEDIFWAGIDPHVEPPKPGERWFRGHPHNSSRLGLALWLTRSQPDAQFYGDTTAYEISPNARFGTYKDLVRAVRESGAKRSEIKPASGFDGHNDNDFIYVPKVQKRLQEMGIDALLISDVMTNYEIDALVVLNKKIVRVAEEK
jgi:ribosomal protein S18 acetylase RimI-like enzyme